jgi:hypothetical protein
MAINKALEPFNGSLSLHRSERQLNTPGSVTVAPALRFCGRFHTAWVDYRRWPTQRYSRSVDEVAKLFQTCANPSESNRQRFRIVLRK